MNSISFTISVYNELEELDRLLQLLKSVQTVKDEIVIVHTYREEQEKETSNFKKIENLSQSYSNIYKNFHFQDKFADLKNYLNSLATKDYIINFDADEFASIDTINIWKRIIEENHGDMYAIPRINTVEDLTKEDIEKYQWNVNTNGWINWPDYQPRIFKNTGEIKWLGDVHERLTGYKRASGLPEDPRFAIIHRKHIDRQRKQNELYENIIHSRSS